MTTPTAARLAELLAAVEESLEREDAQAAARAVEATTRLCAEAAATGVQLDREDLAHLLEQHARVQARALQVQREVAESLHDAGRSRRAADAYGRR